MSLPTPYWTSPDGRHVIYCADCLTVLPLLTGVDAVVTDPPYGIGFKYESHIDDAEQYGALMRAWIKYATPIVSGSWWVWQAMLQAPNWHKWFPSDYRIFAACKGFVQYRPQSVQHSWDPVVFWGKLECEEPSVERKDFHIQNLAPFGAGRERIEHPCPRPLDQVIYVLELANGETILDPFMGSGTTGVACIRTGRRFIGIEIEPKYCAIARERMERELAQPCLPTMEPERAKQEALM